MPPRDITILTDNVYVSPGAFSLATNVVVNLFDAFECSTPGGDVLFYLACHGGRRVTRLTPCWKVRKLFLFYLVFLN
jgi:hypothetical protein